MANNTLSKALFSMLAIALICGVGYGQEVPIINYSINAKGKVELEVNSTTQDYFILKVKHHEDSLEEWPSSMTLGKANSTIITEPLSSYPLENYKVLKYSIASPIDTDGDGIDDVTEFNNSPSQNPINPTKLIDTQDGLAMIDDTLTFEDLSVKKDYVQFSEFLNGKVFTKFIIVDFNSTPKIYFINSSKYNLHNDFAKDVGIEYLGDEVIKGQVIYHPNSISNNGTHGTYAFNYSNGLSHDFDVVQKTNELVAANMVFLENNLSYYITENNQDQYYQDSVVFQNSRVSVLFEADIYAGLDYWGLNPAEGYGFFHEMSLEEIPRPKDIVLYKALPNTLPRVGGIMTSVIQTPLSHVNIRAIQDNVPNAFIRDPLNIEAISNLLEDYIYFKVEQDDYIIRKASVEEVNQWYEDLRPPVEQKPPLNSDYKSILALDQIDFSMFDGYGAKCTNVAAMLSFGFPDKTIPDGFGVPFYFYQEFMRYNNFFESINSMLKNPDFIADREVRNSHLKALRKKIEDAEMPAWMLSDLASMQASFPEGTNIRCRSSSNNEDLPGFNGAGLYDSKTQRPDEGHISKSIKEVYASLWNLRAFEERDFYRVNHFVSSMGVLCHPNYSDEKANGVGVSTDPIYNTNNTFYLNTQIGEDLITNPDANSVPEEILLELVSGELNGYVVVERSNLIANDTIIMSEAYLEQMREYLSKIHNAFEQLYNAEDNSSFAMDIEYKITSDDQLIIKQARPWVAYTLEKEYPTSFDLQSLKIYPNPSQDFINVQCYNCELSKVIITNIQGQKYLDRNISYLDGSNFQIPIQHLSSGVYIISGYTENGAICDSKKFIINQAP